MQAQFNLVWDKWEINFGIKLESIFVKRYIPLKFSTESGFVFTIIDEELHENIPKLLL